MDYDQQCTFIISADFNATSNSGSKTGGSTDGEAASGDDGSYEHNLSVLGGAATAQEISTMLESTKDDLKLRGMRELLFWRHNGTAEVVRSYERLFMTVIRFAAPSKNHEVRKLTQLYWETIPQTDEDGNMRQEMILVSNFIRNDLQHPNEYVRGSTLRSIAKMCTPQLLGSIADCIPPNLTHHHPYVRRNAVMCVGALAQKFGKLPFNVNSVLENMAFQEVDVATQRAAILALAECDPVRATELYILEEDKISSMGEACQLALIRLIRKIFRLAFRTFPPVEFPLGLAKEQLIERLYACLDSRSDTVLHEAATALLWTSDFAPAASRAACQALVKVALNQKEISVRLHVMDTLKHVTSKVTDALDNCIIDVLRVLSSPSLDVRKKVLACVLPAVTSQNATAVIETIKLELVKSMNATETPHRPQLQELLVQAMRYIGTKFPAIAANVIELLLDFLTEGDSESSSKQVAHLVRELLVTHGSSDLRQRVLSRLVEAVGEIQYASSLRMCCWILGELCDDAALRKDFMDSIFSSLAPLPLSKTATQETVPNENTAPVEMKVRTIILPDGSYGTENVYESGQTDGASASQSSGLRKAICQQSDSLLAAVLGVALAKVCLRSTVEQPISGLEYNKVLLVVGSLIKLFTDDEYYGPNSDIVCRLNRSLNCIIRASGKCSLKSGVHQDLDLIRVVAAERETALQEELNLKDFGVLADIAERDAQGLQEVDDILHFRTVTGSEQPSTIPGQDEEWHGTSAQFDSVASLKRAVQGIHGSAADKAQTLSRPNKAKPLSGCSDPIYVEGMMHVNHLDLIIELLVVNQTNETVQNVTIYLGAHGDLRVLDRPPSVTLGPGEKATVFGTLRLSSAEAGVIFGYCAFERRTAADQEFFALGDLNIDLLDCIRRAYIGDMSFRSMWAEFEWENKIPIQVGAPPNAEPSEVAFDFLSHLLKRTKLTAVGVIVETSANRRKLTAAAAADENHSLLDFDADNMDAYIESLKKQQSLQQMAKSSVFAINLCSRSIFGEDALVNLSLERLPDGRLSGAVRIRSRAQGIALALGDAVSTAQRTHTCAATAAAAAAIVNPSTAELSGSSNRSGKVF